MPAVLFSFYRWNCWYIDRYTKILKLLDVYMFFLLHSVAFVVAFALRGKLMDSRLIVIAIGGRASCRYRTWQWTTGRLYPAQG